MLSCCTTSSQKGQACPCHWNQRPCSAKGRQMTLTPRSQWGSEVKVDFNVLFILSKAKRHDDTRNSGRNQIDLTQVVENAIQGRSICFWVFDETAALLSSNATWKETSLLQVAEKDLGLHVLHVAHVCSLMIHKYNLKRKTVRPKLLKRYYDESQDIHHARTSNVKTLANSKARRSNSNTIALKSVLAKKRSSWCRIPFRGPIRKYLGRSSLYWS